MIRRTYDGWGYSPLKQITRPTSRGCKPVWGFATGETRVHEAPPLVNNGVMFVVDAEQPGDRARREDRQPAVALPAARARPGVIVLHDTNRGVALYGDKVYFAAGEAVLVALDARTGKRSVDHRPSPTTSRPTTSRWRRSIAGGKVMIGASGGEFGVRGFVAAFDPETGKELWRTFTVPAPGEPGSETWPQGRAVEDRRRAGLGHRQLRSRKPTLAYWGTGNGGPWMGDQRPGDNLYVASTVAIDVATGQIKGHFQYQPERVVGLGRGVAADPGRLPAQRPDDQGADQRRAQRLHVVPRARRRRQDQLRRRQAVRDAERLPRSRSEDRASRRRPGAQAGHRQGSAVLPVVARRQELAADRVQPRRRG